jgi:hypothetical protein
MTNAVHQNSPKQMRPSIHSHTSIRSYIQVLCNGACLRSQGKKRETGLNGRIRVRRNQVEEDEKKKKKN